MTAAHKGGDVKFILEIRLPLGEATADVQLEI
jgi:hypothetical protein